MLSFTNIIICGTSYRIETGQYMEGENMETKLGSNYSISPYEELTIGAMLLSFFSNTRKQLQLLPPTKVENKISPVFILIKNK